MGGRAAFVFFERAGVVSHGAHRVLRGDVSGYRHDVVPLHGRGGSERGGEHAAERFAGGSCQGRELGGRARGVRGRDGDESLVRRAVVLHALLPGVSGAVADARLPDVAAEAVPAVQLDDDLVVRLPLADLCTDGGDVFSLPRRAARVVSGRDAYAQSGDAWHGVAAAHHGHPHRCLYE